MQNAGQNPGTIVIDILKALEEADKLSYVAWCECDSDQVIILKTQDMVPWFFEHKAHKCILVKKQSEDTKILII